MFWHKAAPERICSLRGALSDSIFEETINNRGAVLASLLLVFQASRIAFVKLRQFGVEFVLVGPIDNMDTPWVQPFVIRNARTALKDGLQLAFRWTGRN